MKERLFTTVRWVFIIPALIIGSCVFVHLFRKIQDKPPEPEVVRLLDEPVANPEKAARLIEELASAVDEVSGGGLPKGSFRGWYLPRIQEARRVGATMTEIEVRVLYRISNLVREGKYCGEDLRMIDRQGPHALRLYLGEVKMGLNSERRRE